MTEGSEDGNKVEEESPQEAGGSESPEDKKVKKKKATKPPRHLSVMRHCISSTKLHAGTPELEQESVRSTSPIEGTGFLPVFRSGSCSDKGNKEYMEDQHICIDNLHVHLGAGAEFPSPCAFYGVFDGHDGPDAAAFIRDNILKFAMEDSNLPVSVEKALKNAFVRADHALADANSQSGTTALTALIFGRKLHVANAGDCRAVLGKRGRAIQLSRDHKPNCVIEKLRIEKLGGIVFDGYLNYSNSQLSVARALGDWHMKGPKGSLGPLSAEPELQETILTEEDEFLIIGCDGLWDVMSSQGAVTMVRKELMIHNDPERCCQELVREALKRNSLDNLTVVIVCFSSDPPPRIEIPRFRVRRSISAEGLNFLKGALDGN